ncbi:Cell division protein FtsY, chloroplastic [Tetrabaena socialis]|uniref:Cell division protein FtsY, chloroplastic n=1 Tax=Tetrabaena socialis TaxID=47790 RepID=A0A2J8A6R5_9CHLO|nr:Cell division protein FtsY, chloroplastic [Tetrabaena socialis]|eukprot:PNH08219.1 Cell division protein FtsY, chloroplastic [Tetrabaena socialis]
MLPYTHSSTRPLWGGSSPALARRGWPSSPSNRSWWSADFGPKTALKIVDRIREGVKKGRVKSADDIRDTLKASIVELLTARGRSSELKLQGRPAAILIVGVNGAGKTTTVGKIAYKYGKEGAKVYLIPGDTFRAAAAEQLTEWARRANATIGTFREGARPQVVIATNLDELRQRTCKDPTDVFDLVLVDTAGRLHAAYKLMEELTLCKAAVSNALPGQPDETLLVLDGTTGLNMLNQAREFNDAVRLTGLILTKLDGTARGGAVVSVVDQLGLPVKFIGVGETAEDLQPFDAEAFAEALFPRQPAAAVASKLMEELTLCKAAVSNALPGQPDETLLVLDGTTGLNMLNQAREFNDAVRLTGLILTKLDGTARGGAVVSVVDQLGLPVKFIGVGETAEDLQPFDAEAFAEALFPRQPAAAVASK